VLANAVPGNSQHLSGTTLAVIRHEAEHGLLLSIQTLEATSQQVPGLDIALDLTPLSGTKLVFGYRSKRPGTPLAAAFETAGIAKLLQLPGAKSCFSKHLRGTTLRVETGPSLDYVQTHRLLKVRAV